MTRRRWRGALDGLLVLGAVLVLGACAETPQARTASAPTASGGDLPAALPVTSELSDRGRTGEPVRVVRGARRERALALYPHFLEWMARRDEQALRDAFDDPVVDPDSGAAVARATFLEHLGEWMARMDAAQLTSAASSMHPTVHSYGDLRRMGRTPGAGMRPEDWLVEVPAGGRVGLTMGLWLPRAILVRWVDDEPHIAGISRLPGMMWR